MDFPTIVSLDGNILISEPNTMKNGPKNADCMETIQAVEVFPILVPKSMRMELRKLSTPELVKVTVSEEISVLDWIMAVATLPNRNPPKGKAVTLEIARESFSTPKC